jgi:carboxypeptidase C (cathepsin A)
MSETGMSEKKSDSRPVEHKAPRGKKSSHEIELEGETLEYSARADWLVLRTEEKPKAEMFHVAYLKKGAPSDQRPVTFVFNGGPGASSAYLHVGALGPKRVVLNNDGSTQKPPARLVDNPETWLAFTDLVFVDPIGTGFSRLIEQEKKDDKPDDKPEGDKNKEFYRLKRDLESLGEFIQKFLSGHKRWDSPVFIAGESYGGFRVGKLARLLQEGYGIGLNGAILISPALEWMLLDPSDYDVLPWVDLFPTMALAARYHGKSRIACSSDQEFRTLAEEFAITDLSTYLVQGDRLEPGKRQSLYRQIADFLGLDQELVALHTGRIPFWVFCRTLLRDSREVCGFYDATIRAIDPFPDRETHQAPDPTLYAIERVFAGGINTQLRQNLSLETERDYTLLSEEVNAAWKVDTETHAFERQVGATDDLRYALSLNPHMNVFLCHGIYDLVTPYFSTDRILEHMKLADTQRDKVTVRHFPGGHMFYAWEESRIEFTAAMREFFQASL